MRIRGAAALLGLSVAASFVALAAGAREPFVERAHQLGLDFHHFNGMTGEFYFPEMTGQGCALLDYDNDGDLDVYLVQGSPLGSPGASPRAAGAVTGGGPPRDRLFRNELRAAGGEPAAPRFVDVTASAGIVATGYGMGVATGDFDDDGFADLYLTNYGANQLWRNNRDGTFADHTAAAGVGDDRWGTSATFLDYDGDGWLDLYVVNYVEFDLRRNPRCYSRSSRRDYCGPADFEPQPDRLFRNRGDGTFADATARALPSYRAGPGLGVVVTDANADGWPDLYVANDGALNQLWLNQRDGSFRDEALLAGVAVNRYGSPEASMGVVAGDFDRDGDEDLFLTHLMGETNTLYVNDGSGLFEDRTIETGLGPGSLPYTAFGTLWLDYDSDGWLDLLVLNGAVRILEEQAAAGDPYPLHQPNQLFRNLDGRGFHEVTDSAGEAFRRSRVSRGAALGDVDNDGDPDVLIANNNGPAELLVNVFADSPSWSGVALAEGASGARGLGTRIEFVAHQGPSLWRWMRTGGSYSSASDPRAVAAFGNAAGPRAVQVEPPHGPARRWLDPVANRYLILPPGEDFQALHTPGEQ